MKNAAKPGGLSKTAAVSNLVRADYSEQSALSDSLVMAVEHLAKRISLFDHTYQG